MPRRGPRFERRATLIVAKMDRLSRNAHFLTGLLEAKVPIVFCDFPDIPPGTSGEFILGMMAQVAALERGMIADRTKNALAAIRAKIARHGSHTTKAGKVITRLGNPNGAAALQRSDDKAIKAGIASKARANAHAE